MTAADFLTELRARAATAAAEESAWRQEAARRGKQLELARAHAFRRWTGQAPTQTRADLLNREGQDP